MDRGPACCVAGSSGALFAETIEPLIDRDSDMVMSKHTYSALRESSLLPALRGGLITELYIVGTITNVQVYATVLEATQHGYSIVLIEDCLGYVYRDRHDEALRQMCEEMGAEMVTSTELVSDLTHHDGSVLSSTSSLPIVSDERVTGMSGTSLPVDEHSQSEDSVQEVYSMLQQIGLKDPTWAQRAIADTMKLPAHGRPNDKSRARSHRSARVRGREEPSPDQAAPMPSASTSPASGRRSEAVATSSDSTKPAGDVPHSPATGSNPRSRPASDKTAAGSGRGLAHKGARGSLRE